MRLREKIPIVTVPLVVVPLLVLGGIAYQRLESTSRGTRLEQVATVLQHTELQLTSLTESARANVELFSRSPLLTRYVLTEDELERYTILQRPLLRLFSSYQEAHPEYEEIRVLLPDGYEDVRAAPRSIPNLREEEGDSAYFQELAQSKDPVHTTIKLNPDTGRIVLYVSKRLTPRDPMLDPVTQVRKLRAYLCVTVSLEVLARAVRVNRIGGGGAIAVTNGSGAILFHPSDQWIGRSVPPAWVDRRVWKAGQQDGLRTTLAGNAVWILGSRVRDDLFLFGILPAAELSASARGLAMIVASIILATVLVSSTSLVFVLSRLVVRPIQQLAHAAGRVGEGHLDVSVVCRGHDEVGALADAFNRMTEDLRQSERVKDEASRHALEHELALQRADLKRSYLEREHEVLRASRDAAEVASRSKSQFLATMSHEIRTPMNGILGMLELLSSESLPQKQRRLAREAYRSARDLLTILNDILDFSKIEAGKMKLEEGDFDLREVIQGMESVFGVWARGKGLIFASEITPDVPIALRGDPGRLRQILSNLVGNAVKFTERGRVDIRVTTTEQTEEAACLWFEVRDTGIGIAPHDLERIFESFAQADGSMTRRFGGTGLGLAISKRLVGLMGGEIGAASWPGEGSMFWFTARFGRQSATLGRPTADDLAEPDASKASMPFRGRILLAEDNPVNQEVALGMLESLGCSIDLASNGQEAVAAVARCDYDLIFMDCMMPVVDGFEATRQIRAREEAMRIQGGDSAGRRRTPIVALTAHALDDARESCRAAGMDDYLSKPFNRSGLSAACRRWLSVAPQDGGRDDRSTSSEPDRDRGAHINRSTLDAIRVLPSHGGPSILQRAVEQYVTHSPRLLEALRHGLAGSDPEAIRRAAHSLKSSSVNLGAEMLSALCKELEAKGRAGTTEGAAALVAAIEAEYEAVRGALMGEVESECAGVASPAPQ